MTRILGNVIINLPSKLVKGGIEMKKDEILKKARGEKKDEGIDNVNNKGLSLGYKIFMLLSVILILFNKINNIESYDILSLMFGFSVAEFYLRYKFLKEKSLLISSILCLIACLVSLICHIFFH